MWLDDLLFINPYKIKNRKKLAQFENDLLFMNQFQKNLETAMRRYRLKGLPDTCSERVILQSLIFNGKVAFYKDGETVFGMQAVESGKGFNINGDPVSAYVFSRNGLINKEIDLYIKGADNSAIMTKGINSSINKSSRPAGVMVYENKQRYPFMHQLIYFTKAIADTYRTIDINRTWLKHPFMPICPETMVNSITEVFAKIENNEKIIPVSTGMKQIDELDFHEITGREEAITRCVELIDWYEQKYREACGFDANSSIDKKGENLLTDEINFNEDFTEKQTNAMIEYLQEQFDYVNEVLGTNITVEEYEGDEETELPGDDTPGTSKSGSGDAD